MQTPDTDVLRILYEQVNAGNFRDDHHNVGKLQDSIQQKITELTQAWDALKWLMRDGVVTESSFIGPAIEDLSARISEAVLSEARESIAT